MQVSEWKGPHKLDMVLSIMKLQEQCRDHRSDWMPTHRVEVGQIGCLPSLLRLVRLDTHQLY